MKYLNFYKMHGIGNDFILIDGRTFNWNNRKLKQLTLRLCPRRYGIGADGVIFLKKAEDNSYDYKMKIFNADGSEAEMCGNGIRTLTHFIKYLQISEKWNFNIKTKAGIIETSIINYGNKRSKIKVNMGQAEFQKTKIPAILEAKDIVDDYKITIDNQEFLLNSVSIGNPHTVIFVNSLKEISVQKIGPKIENHKIFPKKTNVEFVEVQNCQNIKMRVWERGVGETLACGTGASAAAVISAKKGYTSDNVSVNLKGGNLNIKLVNKKIFMTGNSKMVYQGKIKL